jgi:hypothetical protein
MGWSRMGETEIENGLRDERSQRGRRTRRGWNYHKDTENAEFG